MQTENIVKFNLLMMKRTLRSKTFIKRKLTFWDFQIINSDAHYQVLARTTLVIGYNLNHFLKKVVKHNKICVI